MRILLVCHGLPPESVGGVEQHVDGLSRALAELGHDVHVFVRSSMPGEPQGTLLTTPGAPSVTRAAYRWEGLTGFDSIYECEPMAATMRRFLAERRAAGETFDVAHVHHLTGLSTHLVRELRAAGLPVVLTLHDYWLPCPRGQMFHVHEVVCERLEPARCGECLHHTYRHWIAAEDGPRVAAAVHARALAVLAEADRLVVPSARAIPPFAQLGVDPARFTVVENGVDTEALETLPPPACGPGPLRVGYLGTLLPSKGLHVLIDAVQRLPHGTVELAVHGNAVSYHGDDRYLLRCFAALRPGDRVSYHGPYRGGDLPRILEGLDVVAAPALWHEAFGLTVREALAAGRPILVSRIGGLQDAVTDGVEGRVLPPGDAAAWAEAIAALAADRPALRAMAARCRPRARGFRAMAEDLLRVYAGAGGPAVPAAPAVPAEGAGGADRAAGTDRAGGADRAAGAERADHRRT